MQGHVADEVVPHRAELLRRGLVRSDLKLLVDLHRVRGDDLAVQAAAELEADFRLADRGRAWSVGETVRRRRFSDGSTCTLERDLALKATTEVVVVVVFPSMNDQRIVQQAF